MYYMPSSPRTLLKLPAKTSFALFLSLLNLAQKERVCYSYVNTG
jgi:hypothetical protein